MLTDPLNYLSALLLFVPGSDTLREKEEIYLLNIPFLFYSTFSVHIYLVITAPMHLPQNSPQLPFFDDDFYFDAVEESIKTAVEDI